MPTAQKERVIEETKELYGKAIGVVFTDFRGLKVKELQQLRNQLKAKGGEIHVVKNTLFRLAAGDDAGALPYELHNGPTAIAFLFENESAGAKVLVDYASSHKSFVVKGGLIAGKTYDSKGVEALSKLPTREVLLSQLIGTIAAPIGNLIGLIEALYADPIRTIGAVADKMGGGAPAEEAPATAAAMAPGPSVEAPADGVAETSEPFAEAVSDAEPAPEAPADGVAETSEPSAEAASDAEPALEASPEAPDETSAPAADATQPTDEPTTSEASAEEAEATTESASGAADSPEEPAS